MRGVLLALSLVAAGSPGITMRAGEVQWLLPGALHAGSVVRCAGGRFTVPASVTSVDEWTRHAALAIDVRANGAAELACGGRTAPPHAAKPPYVIGQTGLALIRGANRRSAVVRAFGAPTRAGRCTFAWRTLGLRAVFGGRGCTLLRSASVSGDRWTSLTGVQVGDSLARMLWQVPGARRVSRSGGSSTWLLAGAIASHSRLYAVVGGVGTVTALTCSVRP
jgi:hypothetical protein